MAVRFVAYIDESGDTGIQKVRPIDVKGASEWLVLSCLLVRIENDTKTDEWVKEIQSKFRNVQTSHLHFADLTESKKRIACEIMATKPCRYFVVLSNKKNIRGYRNPNLDDGNRAWIYWWLTRLLLERVTAYCEDLVPYEEAGSHKLRIIFSRRGGLRYIDCERYFRKLRQQSAAGMLVINTGDLRWSVVDFDEIFALGHKSRAGLQLADIGAGAFFQALERNRPANCTPECAKTLAPRMARDERNNVLGHGIKTMPDLASMNLLPEQREIFEYYGYSKDGWHVSGP